jgi:hypothetical protein
MLQNGEFSILFDLRAFTLPEDYGFVMFCRVVCNEVHVFIFTSHSAHQHSFADPNLLNLHSCCTYVLYPLIFFSPLGSSCLHFFFFFCLLIE